MKIVRLGAARRRLFFRISPWLCLALIGTLACAGCSPKSGLNREFAMSLNGSDYPSRLGKAFAYLQEHEAGFSTDCRCSVIFPLQRRGVMHRPGLEIVLDPKKIVLGEVIDLATGAGSEGVQVSYHPASGHNMSRAIMLAYSLRRAGGGTIRIDELDLRIGGRVKGRLLDATLYAYFEDAHSAQITEPREPRKLVLQNFPFEVTLEGSPF